MADINDWKTEFREILSKLTIDQMKQIGTDPNNTLRRFGTSASNLLVAANEESKPKLGFTDSESAQVSAEWHYWGFYLIFNEAATLDIGTGLNIGAQIANAIAHVPGIGDIAGIISKPIAAGLIAESSLISYRDTGDGIYLVITFPQAYALLLPGAPQTAALVTILVPHPN